MKVIVPMAGRGSRLRPHTLTVPKPLIPVGGKPIVHRLVEDIAEVCTEKIEEIAFVIGDFGSEVEKELITVAEKLGAKGSIYYQDKPLGTAHAVLCAKELIDGPVVIAFADTLFKADFKLNSEVDGILWVKQIEDPSSFGVVKLDQDGSIIDFIEKPNEFVSDLAMIGIYYVKDGNALKNELEYLIENDIQKGGEYQLPDAFRRLTESGAKLVPGKVIDWLDCGNKDVTVDTNKHVIEYDHEKNIPLISKSLKQKNSVIIPPCFIDENVEIENSVIGPHVSIGSNTTISNSIISNSIILDNAELKNVNASNSFIGSHAKANGKVVDFSLGDFCKIDY